MVSEQPLLEHIPNTCDAKSIWLRVPVKRRASVFILLFLGRLGELRVVLTKRSLKLKSFPGHISLPGGKANDLRELHWLVARREMHEEIGLSEHNDVLEKSGVRLQHLGEMPCYLLRTFSTVKPCVGFLSPLGDEVLLKLRLNPGESSGIFSCPLKDFLFPATEEAPREALERSHDAVSWAGIPWNLRLYTFLQQNTNEAPWLLVIEDLLALDELDLEKRGWLGGRRRSKRNMEQWGQLGSRRDEKNQKIYDVWGLTANILHDLAETVYLGANEPAREKGEELLIESLWKAGQMRSKRSTQEVGLMLGDPSVTFGDVLPEAEFSRLERLYKM